MTLTEETLIVRLLEVNHLSIKARTFVKDMGVKIKQFGSLKDGQRATLLAIATQHGIQVINNSPSSQSSHSSSLSPVVEVVKGTCGYCFDGIVLAKEKQTKNLYSFVCECKTGQRRLEKYPVWSGRFDNDYEVEKNDDKKS